MSPDAVEAANAILGERGYRRGQLSVHVSALPGRVLLKGSKIVSPLADAPETVLEVVRDGVPPADVLGEGLLTPHALRARLDQAGGSGGSSA